MLIAILLLLGPIVGIISSFFGVGGGIIIVPTLYMLFPKIPPQMVIATSLTVICFNSLINTIQFTRLGKRPNIKVALLLGVFMALGAMIISQFTQYLEPSLIRRVFGVIVILIAIRTLLAPNEKIQNKTWVPDIDLKKGLSLYFFTFLGGVISGITGLGGGAVVVPVLIVVLRTPFAWVSAYSNPAMMIGTLVGLISYGLQSPNELVLPLEWMKNFQWGYVNFALAGLISLGSSFTSKFGIMLGKRLSPDLSKKLFVALLFFFGLRIFISSFS